MKDVERDFCLSVLGTRSKLTMAEYKSYRNECEWVPFRGHFFTRKSVPGTAAFPASAVRTYVNYEGPHGKSCQKWLRGGDEFRIFRLGPFESDGNNDKWYQFGMEDLMPDLNGKEIGLRGYLQGAVDADGELLGYPPIQLHHIHFSDLQCNQVENFTTHFYSDESQMRLFRRPIGWPVWADTHTDKQCSEEMGGTDCLIRLWPKRFAEPMKLQRSGCFFGDYMDVRQPNSPQLTWWVESMMRITPRIEQYLGAFGLLHSKWVEFHGMKLAVSEYLTDLRNETVVWSSMNAPYTGRAVLALKHTHRLMTEDFFAVRGNPNILGLPEMQLLNHQNFQQRDVSPHLMQYKKAIFERIQNLQKKGLAELVCSHDSQVHSTERVNGWLIDRMLPLPCAGWKFHENETFTMITFQKAQQGFEFPKYALNNNVISMHSILYVYGVPEEMPEDPSDVMMGFEGISNENLLNTPLIRKFHNQTKGKTF